MTDKLGRHNVFGRSSLESQGRVKCSILRIKHAFSSILIFGDFMSKKFDDFRVGKKHDKRRKLSDNDRAEIKSLYGFGFGVREIARRFDFVCRRTIQFVLFPERLATVNYSGHWAKYYNKKKHTEAMRRHRDYKKKLIFEAKK